MESLTSPRAKNEEKVGKKAEIDIFYSLPVDEQRDFLNHLLCFRDTMEMRYPEVKAPRLTNSKMITSKNLYIHVVEVNLNKIHSLSDIPNGYGIKLSVGKKSKKTKLQKEFSCVLNEAFLFKKVNKKKTLLIEVISGVNNIIAEVKLPIYSLEETHIVQRWYPLQEKKNHGQIIIMGSISIRYCYTEDNIEDLRFIEDTFKVIGSSLSDIQLHDQHPIPLFLIKLTDYLRAHGLKEEGLFRVSGNLTLVQELKERINTGNTISINLSQYPIAVISSLYKHFFDSLPSPLLPYHLSHFFLECKNNVEDLATLINKLPTSNRQILSYLISFLREVAEYEEYNKMSTKNLAITFGPIIFRLDHDLSPTSSPSPSSSASTTISGMSTTTNQSTISVDTESSNPLALKLSSMPPPRMEDVMTSPLSKSARSFRDLQEQISQSQKGRSCLETLITHFPSLFPSSPPTSSSPSEFLDLSSSTGGGGGGGGVEGNNLTSSSSSSMSQTLPTALFSNFITKGGRRGSGFGINISDFKPKKTQSAKPAFVPQIASIPPILNIPNVTSSSAQSPFQSAAPLTSRFPTKRSMINPRDMQIVHQQLPRSHHTPSGNNTTIHIGGGGGGNDNNNNRQINNNNNVSSNNNNGGGVRKLKRSLSDLSINRPSSSLSLLSYIDGNDDFENEIQNLKTLKLKSSSSNHNDNIIENDDDNNNDVIPQLKPLQVKRKSVDGSAGKAIIGRSYIK